MPQFARPIVDVARGSWVTDASGTTNLWQRIDDDTPNDADFVQSALGDNTAYEVRLSSVAPAVIPRAHAIILRGHKHAANGNQKGVTVELLQGSTVLGSRDFPDLTGSPVQQTIDMPRAMAAGITDYADLRIRFTPTGITSGGSSRRRVVITGIALRVPSAIDLVDDLRTRWSLIGATPTEVREELEADLAAQPDNNVLRWRYEVARGLWKVIEYEKLRAAILDGSYTLPPHQTIPGVIADIDRKIAHFIAEARAHDDETQVPATTTTAAPGITTTVAP